MRRPDFVTNEDIQRWSDIIDSDPTFPKDYADQVILREVCYAGLWLSEKLQALDCPLDLVFRIQWTAGKISFGRDAWEVHQQMLNDYIDNKLIFEADKDLN